MPRDQLLRFLAGLTQEIALNEVSEDPPIVEAPAPPAKRQRKVKEFFRDVSASSASTETPETASINFEVQSELFGEVAANGHVCDNIKGKCFYHAEGANRCLSMVDGNREQ